MKSKINDEIDIEQSIPISPEKKLTSVNDLRSEHLKEGRQRSIDDFRSNYKKDKHGMGSIDEYRLSQKDSALSRLEMNEPELAERRRMENVTEKLKSHEWIQPEKWKTLDQTQKKVALDRSGVLLSEAYKHPKPPLYLENLESTNSLGNYGNGFKCDPAEGVMKDFGMEYSFPCHITGSEYGISLNKSGEVPGKQRLFGDDPREAMRTYAHEFRHSYQLEQVSMYEKPHFRHLVDNQEQAKEWSENVKNYIEPPDRALMKEDPESYKRQFEKYESQPVERDANKFADDLTDKVYT